MDAAPAVLSSPKAALEVADILRQYGEEYRQGCHPSREQRAVMRAIEQCRTAALGGHVDECDTCGTLRISYNSCRNRHCPKPVLSPSASLRINSVEGCGALSTGWDKRCDGMTNRLRSTPSVSSVPLPGRPRCASRPRACRRFCQGSIRAAYNRRRRSSACPIPPACSASRTCR